MSIETPLSDDDRRVVDAYRRADLAVVRRAAGSLPAPGSPIVLCVVKNARDTVADFLDHYRTLGAERFGFIDNGSTDGTCALLAAQPDVDLFRVEATFSWQEKQGWINRLIDRYGFDRWYVYADADEQIVYDDCERRPLQSLTALAQAQGLRRVRGFLLDMYSDLPLAVSATGPARLKQTYPFFDAGGYFEDRLPYMISRLGGPRLRAFGRYDPEMKPQLTKHPLFLARSGDLFANPHHHWPCAANFHSPCWLALLHFKFHGAWQERVADAVREQTYWDGSREYRAYARALAEEPSLSLHGPMSRRYERAGDLVAAGLISALAWPSTQSAAASHVRRRRAQRLSAVGGAGEPNWS